MIPDVYKRQDDTSPDYDQAIYDVKKVLIQYQNDMDEEIECLTALLTKFGCVNEGYCDECSGPVSYTHLNNSTA